jgi:hypothetical protein
VLSDAQRVDLPPGSGNTAIEIVDKFMHKIPQKMLPRSVNSIIGYSWDSQRQEYQAAKDEQYKMSKNEAFREFRTVVKAKFKEFIIPGAYVCKPLVQVHNEIKRFVPQMKVFIIRDAGSLKQFRNMFIDRTINNYDIVLIKYTGVSVSFKLDGEADDDTGKLYNMTDAINKIMGGCAFPWAIYDDYDTARLSPDVQELNAGYVDLVSGTNDERAYRETKRGASYKSIKDMIRDNFYSHVWDFPRDQVTCNTFVCAADKKYKNESMNLPHYEQYMYVYNNPNDKYIHLMGVMGNANEVMEALNGDAIQTAAGMLNINTNSVADIFERMLGKSYSAFLDDKYVLSVLFAMKNFCDRYGHVIPKHPKGRHPESELAKMEGKILDHSRNEDLRKKVLEQLSLNISANKLVDEYGDIYPEYKCKLIKRISQEFVDEISSLILRYERRKEEHGSAIKRVQENLRAGKCDICKFPIGKVAKDSSSDSDSDSDSSENDAPPEEGIFIPKCCGIIVCEVCFKDAFHVHQYQDHKTNSSKLVGKCANCPSRTINIVSDVIYINPEFDIGKIVTGFGDEVAPPQESSSDDEETDGVPIIENPKLKAIWSIYHGRKAENRQRIEEKMFYYPETEDRPARWMIDPGTHDSPLPADVPIKILCFAPFTETLRLIMDFCDKHGMKYVSLKGTDLQINDIINNAQKSPDPIIVLVNSEVNCSSLNMQQMTDMVEMCDIKDNHKKIQMRGRLQRIGRKYGARYHILRYRNESGVFKDGDEIL